MDTDPTATPPNTETADAPPSSDAGAGSGASPSSALAPTASAGSAPNCPACGAGFLFVIGKTADGVAVHCFYCNRGFSKPDSGDVGPPVIAGVDGPTAAQPTHEQVAEMTEQNPEHPVGQLHPESARGGGA